MSLGRVEKAIVLTCIFRAGYGWLRHLGVGFRTPGYGQLKHQLVNRKNMAVLKSV